MLSALVLITVVGCGGGANLTPPPTTYAISGTVTGYTGSGLVLQNNAGNNLAVSGNGGFAFTNPVASGGAYSVTVLTQPTSPAQTCTVANGSGTASANVTNVAVTCTTTSTTTYTIGGTVTGLTGTGLVLQDNGGNNLAVNASGSFTFSTAIASGGAYNVTVLTQPSGQSCSVGDSSGTATANVTIVTVTCTTTPTYTISGTVTGLVNSGLVLQDSVGGSQTLAANATSFSFTGVASGSKYNVYLSAAPTGQSCSVSNATGTLTANVTNVAVTCSLNTFTIGGTVTGLSGSGELVLQNNGGTISSVGTNGTYSSLYNNVAYGSSYNITVNTQPTGQTCTITNGSGTITANVTNVAITCTTNPTYTIGGTVSGLAGTGLVLQDNNGNNLAVSASGSFTFSTAIASGGAYSVTVLTQPSTPTQTCTVTNGSGTVASANVTNVTVTCTTNSTYSISGTITGVVNSGMVLQDSVGVSGGLTIAANATSFTFTGVASGSTYFVYLSAEPTGQSCSVSNANGTLTANVTNVAITCSMSTFTIGGTVTGLSGSGQLVLQNNGGSLSSLGQNGTYPALFNNVAYGSTYNITVNTQPTGQTCSITNGSGTITANVTNVAITCTTIPTYTIGGTVTGLTGAGLMLQDNNSDTLVVSNSGIFTFATPIASGSAYAVTVLTQPSSGKQTCTVTGGSGTVSANVTNVSVTCKTTTYTIGGTVYNLRGTGLVLQDNLGDNFTVSANGSFTFATALDYGTTYSVTVLTQPAAHSCTVTNGSGTANFNITNVEVACVGEWTWMGGNSTAASCTSFYHNYSCTPVGIYGAGSGNFPGARDGAATWTDSSGNFWLFGGYGIDSAGYLGELNDLWKFSSSTMEWTWVGGSKTIPQPNNLVSGYTAYGTPGVYGTQGTPSSTNIPGGRDGASTSIDSNGNLWLFGGHGCVSGACALETTSSTQIDTSYSLGNLNDLWEYSPSTNQWTWVSGYNNLYGPILISGSPTSTYYYFSWPGSYGAIGSAGTPGGRSNSSIWIDNSGDFWLLGGHGYGSAGEASGGSEGILNDLWEYSPSTKTWVWMAGTSTSNTTITLPPGSFPGGRQEATSWTDGSGNFWLFGGDLYGSNPLNDLWEFTPSTKEWTSVVANYSYVDGVYGTLGIPAAGNIPGSRFGASNWRDSNGNVWVFGGSGDNVDINDLWEFNPATSDWAWMGGSNSDNDYQPAVYGTPSVPAAVNLPGARDGAANWIDSSGNLWLFGGYGYDSAGTLGQLNDLWVYKP